MNIKIKENPYFDSKIKIKVKDTSLANMLHILSEVERICGPDKQMDVWVDDGEDRAWFKMKKYSRKKAMRKTTTALGYGFFGCGNPASKILKFLTINVWATKEKAMMLRLGLDA